MEATLLAALHDLLNWSKSAMISNADTTGDVISTALFFLDLDLVMLTCNQPVEKE